MSELLHLVFGCIADDISGNSATLLMKLTSLGIMVPTKGSSETPPASQHYDFEGFQEGFQLGLHCVERS